MAKHGDLPGIPVRDLVDHLEGILLEKHLTVEQLAEARSTLRELRALGVGQLPEPEVGVGRFRIL